MSLAVFGLNHQSAPLPVLERVAFSPTRMEECLQYLRSQREFSEIAGLSTCNRTEFYFVSTDLPAAQSRLVEAMTRCHQCDDLSQQIYGYTYSHRNERAANHLFRVAAGVDSMVVGEAQILGQIRRAYEMAASAGAIGGMLNQLMLQALTFGRRVRVETNIGRGNVSVASIAHRQALTQMPDMASKTLLVLGTGETAQIAARQFVAEGVGQLFVLNRTQESAQAMAAELGGQSLPLDRLESGLEMADVVVCAVGAPHYVVTANGVSQLMARRSERPLLLIDLSVPRNIDPDCSRVEGVQVLALKGLESIAAENKAQRLAEIGLVEELIEKETQSFVRWTQGSETGKLITAIRRQTEDIRRQQIDRYCRNLPDDQKDEIARFTDSLMRSVLHDVTKNIRTIDLDTEAGHHEFDLVCRLFNVKAEALRE